VGLDFLTQAKRNGDDTQAIAADRLFGNLSEAEKALQELADVFLQQQTSAADLQFTEKARSRPASEAPWLNMEAKYRALVEQIPAVVFMAYLDKGIGEAYVSPQIEAALGFSQREWLEDPVVSTDSSRRQDALELRGCGDVPLRKTAAISVPSDGARRASAVVSV
jgi:hypothetical protein